MSFLKEFKKHYLYEKMLKLHKPTYEEIETPVTYLKSEFQIFPNIHRTLQDDKLSSSSKI